MRVLVSRVINRFNISYVLSCLSYGISLFAVCPPDAFSILQLEGFIVFLIALDSSFE